MAPHGVPIIQQLHQRDFTKLDNGNYYTPFITFKGEESIKVRWYQNEDLVIRQRDHLESFLRADSSFAVTTRTSTLSYYYLVYGGLGVCASYLVLRRLFR